MSTHVSKAFSDAAVAVLGEKITKMKSELSALAAAQAAIRKIQAEMTETQAQISAFQAKSPVEQAEEIHAAVLAKNPAFAKDAAIALANVRETAPATLSAAFKAKYLSK